MPNAYISGTGGYLPARVVTNDDLAKDYGIDTTHEWIHKRTGIEQRHFAAEGEGTAAMGYEAAKVALKRAGMGIRDIDLIIFATLSPEHHFPGSGVYMQREFTELFEGTPKFIPAMDIRNQCSGFLYGLATAGSMVQAGAMKNVLVVGGETHSAALDLTTRGRTVSSLFGDGAGAAIVSATDDPTRGLRKWMLGADGRGADALCMTIWDIRNKPFHTLPEGRGPGWARIEAADLWPQMDGKQVFRNAVERMCMGLMQVCFEMSLSADDIDLFVFHQANMRINQYVAQQLGIPDSKLIHNIHKYGNTTAATIPLLLWEAEETGRLKKGMKIAMVAFGSGFTWGAAIMDW